MQTMPANKLVGLYAQAGEIQYRTLFHRAQAEALEHALTELNKAINEEHKALEAAKAPVTPEVNAEA